MAIKGTESKQNITKELLSYFGDRAFMYNDGKEIRVNCMEAGELVQIKIALTAAKVAVENGSDNALPGTAATQTNEAPVSFEAPKAATAASPTEDEKKNIGDLLRALGL